MQAVRVRTELIEAKGLTPYAVAQADARISLSAMYRLVRAKGRVRLLDADLLDGLCDVLGVSPGELLEREPKKKRPR